MRRIGLIISIGALLLAVALLKKRSDDNEWLQMKRPLAQRHGVDLLTAGVIAVRRNPGDTPIMVKIARSSNPQHLILLRGDFDTTHERELRQQSQSPGEIGQ
jgi:hypothetical protein